MSNELPPLDYLKEALRRTFPQSSPDAINHCAKEMTIQPFAYREIIAHARTLAKYETPPVDPAELKRWQDAREAAVAIVGYRWLESDKAATLRGESDCEAVIRAYKYFCHRDGVEPQDKAPGGVA